jgi:hypothetical protein
MWMVNRMNKPVVLLCLFSLMMVHADAQSWDLKTDKDGIKIYTASVGESSFKSVRATCDVAATLDQLMAVLMDINRHEEWVYSTKVSKILKVVAENDVIFYAVIKTPWPLTNRDYIAHMTATSPSPGMVIIESHTEPNYLPENKDLVRVIHSDSRWVITSTGNNMLHIEYSIHFDPAGSVPAWLLNMFVSEGPYQTFKNLRERVQLPMYRNAHYNFIKH